MVSKGAKVWATKPSLTQTDFGLGFRLEVIDSTCCIQFAAQNKGLVPNMFALKPKANFSEL